MGLTTVDLFRMGNATSARLDHVRAADIHHYGSRGATWVQAGDLGNDLAFLQAIETTLKAELSRWAEHNELGEAPSLI